MMTGTSIFLNNTNCIKAKLIKTNEVASTSTTYAKVLAVPTSRLTGIIKFRISPREMPNRKINTSTAL